MIKNNCIYKTKCVSFASKCFQCEHYIPNTKKDYFKANISDTIKEYINTKVEKKEGDKYHVISM